MCRVHGGSAPQVKAKAAERVEEHRQRLYGLVNPALDRLGRLVDDEASNVALGACKDVLDRNGFKPVDKVEISGSDLLIARIGAMRRRIAEPDTTENAEIGDL